MDHYGPRCRRPYKGQRLETVTFGDYFAFAWLVFWPDTEIYTTINTTNSIYGKQED
ncbi:hypothetical protein SAMN06265218_106164 [Fodinibius sediminis]|uniref:Uncharacterized protein n=1 Tax=Fodinibius sediminis TaxID=1214077 RepID=A0A521CMM4_9BACT|nr:hypothetical protein SAMN06265218_106164 [Fodinibius sediminis]